MAGEREEDGVQPPASNPPDTTLLDARIAAHLESRDLGGGGGGGNDNERLAKLESDVSNLSESFRHMRGTLDKLASEVSTGLQKIASLESELRHKPGKGFIVTAVFTTLTLFAAVILFQHQLQQLFNLTPPSPK